MEVLVVGGTGPTGVYMVEELISQGHKVTVYHTGRHEVEFSQPVRHVHGDTKGLQELEQLLAKTTFDLLINTAGRIRPLVEIAKNRVDRLISISGMGVYRGVAAGEQPYLPLPIPEESPLQDDPSISRFYHQVYLGEKAVMEGHDKGYFRATILRYPLIYGPRAVPPVEWYWVSRILDGRQRLLLPDSGMTIVQRGYAQNLAHAVVLAVEREEAIGKTYNTGDERSLTLREIVEIVADALGHRWELVPVPRDLAPQANPYGLSRHTLLDLTKIKSELGYRDLIDVVEATKKTALWLRDNPVNQEDARLIQGLSYSEEDRLIQEYLASS